MLICSCLGNHPCVDLLNCLQQHQLPCLPSVSTALLLRQVGASTWAHYDDRVEAMLGMEGAGVVESLLRTAVSMPSQPDVHDVLKAQVPPCRGLAYSLLLAPHKRLAVPDSTALSPDV